MLGYLYYQKYSSVGSLITYHILMKIDMKKRKKKGTSKKEWHPSNLGADVIVFISNVFAPSKRDNTPPITKFRLKGLKRPKLQFKLILFSIIIEQPYDD